MNHRDHVSLLRGAITKKGGSWADLGSGGGAFTLALFDIVGYDATIYSVDRDEVRLDEQKEAFTIQFPGNSVQFITKDFTDDLPISLLDGIVMANSLHFLSDKTSFLRKIQTYLKPGGQLIIVEYNTDSGNTWVPYPLSYETFASLMDEAGFIDAKLLDTIPSRFLDEIYSATVRKSYS